VGNHVKSEIHLIGDNVMAYCNPNFKTKKALKEAIALGKRVDVFSPGPFGCKQDGTETIEGPHYPAMHSWYARVQVVNGMVVKVLG
jgi:hypothetical protein